MTESEDAIPEETVQAPRPTENPPLSPEGKDAEWKDNLDAGHEDGPTTVHEEDGWRAAKLSKP